MAVYSMTGWGSAQANGLLVELRSVNGRFLDVALRLPEELRACEPQLRALLAERLRRGKVELRAGLQAGGAAALTPPPITVMQGIAALQGAVLDWLPQARALSVAEALHLAERATSGADTSEQAKTLLALAAKALDALLAAREREGARLAQLLQERIAALRALVQQAEPLAPQAVQAQQQRFLARWNEALAAASATGDAAAPAPAAAQERALAEAASYAIRIDVAEELGRLAAHLDEIEAVLAKGGETGRRLDFLIQELHREANTLGSKSAALELTRISVDMKVLIEQMREQVQNLE
ncbi:MAG: YicC family protein [Ottowia sp.]|nr:YicC family protein [Ottowia sp.]